MADDGIDEPEGGSEQDGITRGDLLRGAAAGGAGLLLGGNAANAANVAARPRKRRVPNPRKVAGMNVLMFMTDQQRAIQHFPPGWAKRNLPGMTQLQKH